LIDVVFVLPGGAARVIAVPEGVTLLEAARRADVAIEGACGGNMACATCHVYLAAELRAAVPPPSAEERDMLDFAEGWSRESRLGCQVRVVAGARWEVRVPATSLLDA
jgi:2Fe-2S ferredoxin